MTGRSLTTTTINTDTGGERAALRPLTVADLFAPVLRHKMLLLGTLGLFLAAAVTFLAMVEPRYTASTVVLIKPTTPESVVGEARERLTRLPVEQDEVRSQMEVIRSAALLVPVTERLNLAAYPDFNPTLQPSLLSGLKANVRDFLTDRLFPRLGSLGEWLGEILPKRNAQAVNPTDVLHEKLQVSSLNRSYAIEIALETRDADLGARTVNALAETYQAFTLQSKSSMTEAASVELAGGIEKLQQKIGAAEKKMEQIREQAGMMQGRTSSLMSERVSDVNAELFRVRSQAETLETKQRVISQALRGGGDLSSAIDVSASPVIGGLRAREAEARARLAQVSTNRGEKNPQVVAVQFELAEVQRFIRGELRKIETSLASELSVARQREQALRQEFETLTKDVSATGQADLVIKSLEREVTSDRTVLETYMSRLNGLRLQDTLEKPDVQIISKADAPQEPSYPKVPMVLGLATVSSLVVGFALATIIEHRDTSFRTLEQVEDVTGIPVAAALPFVRQRRGPSPEQGVVSNPTGLYAESVKQLLVSTCRNRVGGPGAMKLLVTSSLAGEGKTTSAVALGRVASLCGFRTLIIDGDLRRHSIGRLLKLKSEPGLMEILNGEAAFDEAVQADPVSGAHVLPAGHFKPSKQSALNVPAVQALFAGLEPHYDLIVIDTSPILAVSDPQYFLDVADTRLFVVQWGSTSQAVVKTALKQLENSGESIDAIILSKVDMNQQAAYGVAQYGNYKSKLRHYYSS
ncbi:GumC family protein [Azospirillum sp. sgz301742]